MKRDFGRHKQSYESWKKEIVNSKGEINPKYIEEGLTKENTKLFIQFFMDMEAGINTSNRSKKGGRDYTTLNRNRSKIKSFMMGLQEKGVNPVTKATQKDVHSYFKEWVEQGHSTDYNKRFRMFWNWWMKKNRKEGKVILDIAEDLETAPKKESSFVWLNKEEFDEFRKYFNEAKQTALLFAYDTIVRAPSELFGLKVENIYEKNGEVWVNIPDEISKTFGRHFNLIYSGEAIKKHIEGRDPEEYLFTFSYVNFTKEMQEVAKQLWGSKKNQGGEFYKNLTLYDMRHSGAIHFRQLFQKTGQSLDTLRHRGGWSDFRMINYYTKFLGLDGHVNKEKTLLEEDKTKLEKELEELKKFKKNTLSKLDLMEPLLEKLMENHEIMIKNHEFVKRKKKKKSLSL